VSLEDNKSVALEFLKVQALGDFDRAISMLTDDASMWVAGDFANSGIWEGEALAQHFRDLEQIDSSIFAGPIKMTVGAVTAEDDRVCMEAAVNVPLSNGKTYENMFHFLFRIRDGKIAEWKEYMDTKHLIDQMGVEVLGVGERVPNFSTITATIG